MLSTTTSLLSITAHRVLLADVWARHECRTKGLNVGPQPLVNNGYGAADMSLLASNRLTSDGSTGRTTP